MNKLANRLRLMALAATIAAAPLSVQSAPAPKLDFSGFELELAQAVSGDFALAQFYGAHDLQPVFAGPDAAPRREALRAAIAQAPSHGLPTARYRPASLTEAEVRDDVETELRFARVLSLWANDVGNGLVDPSATDSMNKRKVLPVDMTGLLEGMIQGDPAAALAKLPPQDNAYRTLREMLAGDARLVPPADVPQVEPALYRPGESSPQIAALRARLASIGFTAQTTADPQLYDDPLTEAVRAYQQASGLPVDGIAGPRTVGQLAGNELPARTRRLVLAMERLRWLNGHDLNGRHLWVNIPAQFVEIREGGETVFSSRVVVGRPDPDWETPEFSETMKFVVPNPRWNVPKSIAVASYLPKLRANRHAVGHLDVVDRNGRVVPRDQIDFNQYSNANFPYRLRQKPSADNALGRVKFMFPNPWNIYLHDTPSKGLFGNADRAASHGCVRVAKPFELAHELLRGNSDDPQAFFQRALDRGEEQWIKLAEPLPIHLVYFTALPGTDGLLHTYPDIYNRDAKLWSAMQKAADAGS